MKPFIVLQGLSLVAAQIESFSFGPPRVPTSVFDVEPSATQVESGPIDTGRACARISNLLVTEEFTTPAVEAELAFACLKSVPISTAAASDTIQSIKDMVQFQSTLSYLKSPPKGYPNEAVDIVAELDNLNRKVQNGDYDNEYDFENDVSTLLAKSLDGHLGFEGYAFRGVFTFLRDPRLSLISSSEDGKGTPEIWSVVDFNGRGGGYAPSPVREINGKNAVQFLEEEAKLLTLQDADARYNNMFYKPAQDDPGAFAAPLTTYPGPTTKVTFGNGTTEEYLNLALILDYPSWRSVEDPESFYDTFVRLGFESSKLRKRNTQNIPRRLQPTKADHFVGQAVMPDNYPSPVVEHRSSDVPLAGYIVETNGGTVGVLSIQTFYMEDRDSIEEFQSVVEEYISKAKEARITKHIIDLRGNGGGLVMLGYDTYLQFFPSQEPQLQSRYRASDATNILGGEISKLDGFTAMTIDLYTTPFNKHSYVDKDLDAFGTWEDMFGPVNFNDDTFTNLLRYNLSDPLVSSDDRFSLGITMTGYGERSGFTEDPFKNTEIVLLTDGYCASTCALLVELMVQQSEVRTITLGGRPSLGPMQAVGATKGSLVLTYDRISSIVRDTVSVFADSSSEAQDWVNSLPFYRGINFADATVNMQDNIRKGLEKDGIPTQFLNDSASCRIWYERDDYFNVTRLWSKVADVAFGGKDSELKEEACVAGSVTSREQQKGLGEGSPTSPEGGPQPSKKGAATAVPLPTQGGWMTALLCGVITLTSLVAGAGLI